jgi:ribose transport system permease protein
VSASRPETPAVVAPDDAPATSPWASGWRSFLLRPEMGLPLVTLLLGVYLSATSEFFLTRQNLLNITEAVAIIGIAAPFATVVVISGGLDLTPVTVMTVTGIVVLRALQHDVPVVPAVILALLAGAAIGLLNGLLIAIGNLNPFIVTLGTNFLFTGIAYVATEGNSQIIENSTFLEIGQSRLFWNIPTSSVIMLASFASAFFMLSLTRFGTHIFAVGGGEAAARLSGVRVLSVKIWLYVLSALSAAVAGIVLSSASGSVAPYAASNSNDLLSILAAVIIGGTALTGGRGGVVGTAVGILLLGLIANGLVLENISSFYQPVVTGAILLIAIVLDEVRRRVQLRT